MYGPNHHGWIEVVVGPMYSGKSEELIRRLKRAEIAKQNVVVFKPSIDDRYCKKNVVSHNGSKIKAIDICKPQDIYKYINEDTQVIGVDEVQFFEEEIVGIIRDLADKGMRIIAAGLDMDFRGEPFGPTPKLMAIAEFVDKLSAVCMTCGNPAHRTQRLINGKPAKYSDPIVLIGATESYEARCRLHHEVPRD
ncbi:thymidine kinase [Paramaledivibacter caminithermalis]|jgi:thymidine kinase|uniref:Thymidine kinase n=1 Tax=Paramaledivibacter caminithermalis (strain DSM 15212 / CIP 107654 / DViRD3) TaxID=1121301 RepID=A0A1M6L226_PARC5|nr:thymidine kinase [Paramaledivibacter caminithermalis]SHJ65213.1 thymidine kinase [Paramaledivibacter caminithermalis DSM 15212]